MRKLFVTVFAFLQIPLAVGAQSTFVDSLEHAVVPAQTIGELFSGSISGVDMTTNNGSAVGAINTLIRGVNSLKSDSQPLWIIDGAYLNPYMEVEDSFWEYPSETYSAAQNCIPGLNLFDIKSIQVLKDISATSIYGTQGANGVIIVTTGRNSASGKLGIKLNSNLEALSLSHKHNLSLSGKKNNTNYFISGFYNRQTLSDFKGNTGGLRFNFVSKASALFSLGLNSSMNIAGIDDTIPTLPAGSDVDDKSTEYRTFDSFFIALNLPIGLTIRADAGLDYRVKRRYQWYGISTDFGKDKNGAASISSLSAFQYNAALNLRYKRFFGKHGLDTSLQFDANGGNPDFNVMCAYDFVDYRLRAKGISLGSNTSVNRSIFWNMNTIGGYFKTAYRYNDAIGADIAVRLDWNTLFKGKCEVYPSMNAFFDVAKFCFQNSKIVSSFRLDAGIGKAGRQEYVPYQWMSQYAVHVQPVDLDLQPFYDGFYRTSSWEINAGLHLGFITDRILLDVKYYNKKSNEILSTFCRGEKIGSDKYLSFVERKLVSEESGSISNQGIEADININVFNTDDIKWDFSITGSYNINRVRSIPGLDSEINPLCGKWTNSNVIPLSAHQLVGFSTDSNGNAIDHTGDGKLTEADMIAFGGIYPRWLAGISTTFRYKSFSLSASANGRFGCNYLDLQSLIADQSSKDIPGILDRHIKKGDSFRFTRAAVSYDIPMGKASDIMGIKVTLSASNPLPSLGYRLIDDRIRVVAGVCLTF